MKPYHSTALVLPVKYPEPLSVKTRLVNGMAENGFTGLKDVSAKSGRPIGRKAAFQLAAELYRAFLSDRFNAHRGHAYDVILATTQPEFSASFRSITGPDVSQFTVSGASMGEIMYSIFESLLVPYRYVLISGSDMPRLDESVIEEVLTALKRHDIVLVPAVDGAYNLIGMGRLHQIFDISKWSSGSELKETITLLEKRGISYKVLDEIRLLDVDTIEDLKELMRTARTAETPETNACLQALCERLDFPCDNRI